MFPTQLYDLFLDPLACATTIHVRDIGAEFEGVDFDFVDRGG
jgi:hypothetical protein